MSYDNSILIKIDTKTKKRMERLNVNWSDRIREFIGRELHKKARIGEAERIREALFKKAPGLDSTVILRRMRASRYGAGSN